MTTPTNYVEMLQLAAAGKQHSRREMEAIADEMQRYRTALEWISDSNPAATESQIICARRALGLVEA